jgi:ribonuclease P protein component
MNGGKAYCFETIKNRRDFLSANAHAKKFITGTFILQMNPRAQDHPIDAQLSRFGFTVTKKMGNAVVRNRIKRRLREAIRETAGRHVRPGYDYIMISRHKALDCPYADLVRDMEFAFSRIFSMKNVK